MHLQWIVLCHSPIKSHNLLGHKLIASTLTLRSIFLFQLMNGYFDAPRNTAVAIEDK